MQVKVDYRPYQVDYEYVYHGKSQFNRDPEFDLDLIEIIDQDGNDITENICPELESKIRDKVLEGIEEESEVCAEYDPTDYR